MRMIPDSSAAVYWRIYAILATLTSLFSAAAVLWYLVFRDNPNQPDETDSKEKLRFIDELHQRKHNLLSEIITAFRNMPPLIEDRATRRHRSLDGQNTDHQGFIKRLIYFCCGSDESFKNEEHTISDSTIIPQKY